MKIAVLSDIHGNYVALEKCIEYALSRGINIFVFLGDYVGELAYPQKTMDLLYALKESCPCYFIKGNKEDYWANYQAAGETGWQETDSTTGSLYYAYYNLTPRDLQFFKDLPYCQHVHFNNTPPMTLCHGSPNRANEKLLPNSGNTFSIIENDPNQYILCGHTHIQEKIEHKGKVVLNGGSVGVSLHGKGKAQFVIITGDSVSWEEEFISLDYDVEKVIQDLHASGLREKAPYWCIVTENLLRTGEVSHGTVLARAMALCKAETGICNWPNIPEQYWKQAVNDLI